MSGVAFTIMENQAPFVPQHLWLAKSQHSGPISFPPESLSDLPEHKYKVFQVDKAPIRDRVHGAGLIADTGHLVMEMKNFKADCLQFLSFNILDGAFSNPKNCFCRLKVLCLVLMVSIDLFHVASGLCCEATLNELQF